MQAFHEEAISTLTAAAPSAGREMRSLLDPSESIPARAQDIDHSANSSPSIPTTQSTRLSVSLSPPGEDRFFVDEVDVSEKFYHMQEYVFDLVKTNDFALESDVHLILALSSILLLQNNNRIHQAMISFFRPATIRKDQEAPS